MPPKRRDALLLGSYILPGGVSDPVPGLDQARLAEAIGLGTVWIGERYDTKDLPSLAGAVSQVTSRVRIGAAITHTGLRHPMVLASMGQTLQALSGERFCLGIGRSAMWRWRAYGQPAPTLASMADTADILRRLWAGETVTYDGPAGRFPQLRLAQRSATAPPPLLLAAVGPKTLEAAGQCFDGVILHPFLTPRAVRRSVDIVRSGAAAAGRDPNSIRCYAAVVVAPDRSPEATDRAIRSHAAGYFHVSGLGDALVAANGWDPKDLEDYRAHPALASLGAQQADKVLSRSDLVEVSLSMPVDWVEEASAAGTAEECARRLHDYVDAGADELILHGTTPEDLGRFPETFSRVGTH